ncbi:MAG: maleylpyruvate isomerase N-terminal domain-containing protein [Acidimicrobiales bacterium]|nr:maleylpyruvate isomerase N-terminal domain-containing protein [Acidimicrobiales bacterium]
MTERAVAALTDLKADLDHLIHALSDEMWVRPSGCRGWTVRDVVAHLAASAHNFVDPEPEPEGTRLPVDRERQHDVFVERRRDLPVAAVVDEYLSYSSSLIRALAGLQAEPKASKVVSVPGLGSYPLHALANGMAFDYHCHLHHDLLVPRGPLSVQVELRDDAVRSAVEWMFMGLPQMQGEELAESLSVPVCFELSGSGDGVWTILRPDPAGMLVVEEGRHSGTVVRSDAHAFVAWGTKRCDWRGHCQIDGDLVAAGIFLDALDIV